MLVDAPQIGFITTHPATFFLMLSPRPSERTGLTAEKTVSVVEPTWLLSIVRASRSVDNKWENMCIESQYNDRWLNFTQKFISHTIEDMKSGSDIWQNAFWIGLTDRVSEGHWVWVNNVTEVEQRWEQHSYSQSCCDLFLCWKCVFQRYWKDGEPNNLGRLGEDCAMTIYSRHNPWKTRNDGHCNVHVIHWICEINYLDSGVMQKTQA